MIKDIQIEKALALVDIIRAMFEQLALIEVPDSMRLVITKHLADIEYRLASGGTDSLQLCALVGAFFAGRAALSV